MLSCILKSQFGFSYIFYLSYILYLSSKHFQQNRVFFTFPMQLQAKGDSYRRQSPASIITWPFIQSQACSGVTRRCVGLNWAACVSVQMSDSGHTGAIPHPCSQGPVGLRNSATIPAAAQPLSKERWEGGSHCSICEKQGPVHVPGTHVFHGKIPK